MEQTITVKSDDSDKIYWVLPFNEIQPSEDSAIFFYLRNTGELPIELEALSLSNDVTASSIQIHSVLGEPEFVRENDVVPVNKNTWRNGILPDIEVKTCARISELYSIGQLDRLDMPVDRTTYRTKPRITIAPDSIVVLTCSTGDGKLSGIVTITQKITVEE